MIQIIIIKILYQISVAVRNNVSLPNINVGPGLSYVEGSNLFLRNKCDDIHLPVQRFLSKSL